MHEKLKMAATLWREFIVLIADKPFRNLVWQLPQNLAGLAAAHYGIFFTQGTGIFLCKSVLVIRNEDRWGAISLGCFIIGGRNLRNGTDNRLFRHEFGHCLQSRKYGPLYLFLFGLPSLLSACFSRNHQEFWTERDADRRSYYYFRNSGQKQKDPGL